MDFEWNNHRYKGDGENRNRMERGNLMVEDRNIRINEDNQEELIKPFATKQDANGHKIMAQWRDLMLKEELMAGIKYCEFSFPSEVQYKVIPEITASSRKDLLCQAKSGMGKTAVFLIAILEMIRPEEDGYLPHQCIIVGNTRELAHQIYVQICKLSKGFLKNPPLRIAAFFGGLPINSNKELLDSKQKAPHILIGTLGRLRHLFQQKKIVAENVRWFVVDQCDKIVDRQDSKEDLISLLKLTPKEKQLLMFTATLPEQTKKICIQLMRKDSLVIQLSEKKWKLNTLQHYYVKMKESQKQDRLLHLLDVLPFNQVIIFTNTIDRTIKLNEILRMQLFNPMCIHSKLSQDERLYRYDLFKSNGTRLMVATDLFGRGIDIDNVNLVINYDFPKEPQTYLHRAARAARFGKQGNCVNFLKIPGEQSVRQIPDIQLLRRIEKTYDLKVAELPKVIEVFKF